MLEHLVSAKDAERCSGFISIKELFRSCERVIKSEVNITYGEILLKFAKCYRLKFLEEIYGKNDSALHKID